VRSGRRPVRVDHRTTDDEPAHHDHGPLDGEFGSKTLMAVWVFQKIAGLAADGRVTPEVWQAMVGAGDPPSLRPDGPPDRVEIDLARQAMYVYEAGGLWLVTDVSSVSGVANCENGSCGDAVTPTGTFDVYRRIDGWRESPLGMLYNPPYFTGGFAFHGAPSVPDHPASHGCVRVPMHVAEYLPGIVANGEAVYLQ
jgi:L,D-transpeptidase catalytic domain/Putative peptidoglycan binding domain